MPHVNMAMTGPEPAEARRPVPRSAVLIVNARSRRGQDLFTEARDLAVASGISLIAAHAVRNPSDLRGTVRAAVRSGAPMVIVGGGDGSLSGVVDEFVGTDCVFAVLPMGTANSFARTLRLPLDLEEAVDTIANGQLRRIDLGVIGTDYFVNAASVGLGPMIAETVPAGVKRALGRVGYFVWAARCFLRFRPFRLTVDDGTSVHQLWTSEVRIFNGRYHGGVELADSTDVDSGDIVVQAVTGRSRWRLSMDWYAKYFRLANRNDTTVEFRGRLLRLDSKPCHQISIDGELLARMPVEVRVAPRAIEVVVPARSDEATAA